MNAVTSYFNVFVLDMVSDVQIVLAARVTSYEQKNKS